MLLIVRENNKNIKKYRENILKRNEIIWMWKLYFGEKLKKSVILEPPRKTETGGGGSAGSAPY